MTRQISPPTASGNSALLSPLPAAKSRTTGVIERLANEIRSGTLMPGDRLPTEQALMAAMGVSRTVIREAVAALKAEGLVTTRQGSGAYVALEVAKLSFELDRSQLNAVEEAVGVMELRRAVEIEAAGLAAERATSAAVTAIRRAHAAFVAAVRRDELAAGEDFAFHHAIALATGNRRFADFMSFLGKQVVPRLTVRGAVAPGAPRRRYLTRIVGEHARILDAIATGVQGEARLAMRSHLSLGLSRYRRLAAESTKGDR